jgi:hypothetical protein
MSELTIILKDSERTYRQNFLIYAHYSVSEDDPIIRAVIDEARECFGGEPESIQVKIHMEIQ